MNSGEDNRGLERKRRRLKEESKGVKRDEKGVAEIVGNILTLAITVVIFASVFAGVTQIDPPEEQTHIDIDAEYEYGDDYHYIDLIHEGGESLELDSFTFMVSIENEEESQFLELDEGHLGGVSTWSIGEKLEILIEDEEIDVVIDAETTIEIMIRNDDNAQIVYRKVLLDEGREILDINNARIDYRYDWRNHAEPGEEFTIKVPVTAPVYLRREGFDYEDIDVTAETVLVDDVMYCEEEEETVDTVELTYHSGGEFRSEDLIVNHGADYDSYSMEITVEHDEVDEDPNQFISLNVGEPAETRYRADLSIGRIEYSPDTPSHNDEFDLEFEVYNHDAHDQVTDWVVYDNWTELEEKEEVASGERNIEAGPEPTDIGAEWDITNVGEHEILIDLIPEEEGVDGDRTRERLYVEPSVLVVEDTSADDTHDLSLMEDTLTDVNYGHSSYEMDRSDDYPTVLEEYSVGIWLTGEDYNEENPPNLAHEMVQQNLTNYVEDGGNLWVVGSNLYEMYEDTGGGLIFETLGIDSIEDSITVEGELEPKERYENATYGDFDYPVYDGSVASELDPEDAEDENILEESEEEKAVAFGHEEEEEETVERTAVNSFSFEAISDPAARSNMTQEVVRWLTNMTERSTTDVSVSSQIIEPTNPMFMDEISIRTNIRNNGPEDMYSVPVMLLKDGQVIEEEFVDVTEMGGVETVTFNWTAEELGTHELLVVVDEYEELDISSRNNDVKRYKELENPEVTEDNVMVNVDYSILLVDADTTVEDYGGVPGMVNESFARLGQVEGQTYDFELEEDVSLSKMETYNAIVWVTGERMNAFEEDTLLDLVDYFEAGGSNVMFIGEHILNFLDDDPHEDMDDIEEGDIDYLIDMMGIDADGVGDRATPSYLVGDAYLFSLDRSEYEEDLVEGPIDNDLRQAFEDRGYEIEDDAELIEKTEERWITSYDLRATGEWLITDDEDREYLIHLSADQLNIFAEPTDLGRTLRYRLDGETQLDTFTGTSEHGEVLLSDNQDRFASLYDDGESVKNIYMGVNPDSLSGPLSTGEHFEDWPEGEIDTSSKNAIDEFIYTSLWYLGMRDERTDLRVTDYDIELDEEHPETGRSYEVIVQIENYGYSGVMDDDEERGVSPMVRLKEGEDHIDTKTPFVEGSTRDSEDGTSYFEVEPGRVTVEYTWEPLFAGRRPIRAELDPLREIPEIEPAGEESEDGTENKIMEFNNQAVKGYPVYYFHDDMEDGDDRWEHDATLMNVDGRSPFDFIGTRENLDTNVVDDWNWTESGSTVNGETVYGEGEGVYETDNPDIEPVTEGASYSPPRSYWLPESGLAEETYGDGTGSELGPNSEDEVGIRQDIEETWYMRGDNYALDFDGDNDYAETETVDGLDIGDDVEHTISARINVDSLPDDRAWIALLGEPDGGSHHWLIDDDGGTQFGAWGGAQLSPDLVVDEWTHIVMTFDGNELRGYQDGSYFGSLPADGNFNWLDTQFTLAQAHIEEDYFDGQIDDLRIYDQALSENRVEDLYLNRHTGQGEEVLWWPMREGEGDTIYDESGNDNHGDLEGDPEWTEPEHYRLWTEQSDIHRENMIESDSRNDDVEWGLRAWRRDAEGNDHLITGDDPVATVERDQHDDGEEGIQDETWELDESIDIDPDDSLLVRIYANYEHPQPDWEEQASFITDPLGADEIEDSDWTVYYYTEYETDNQPEHYTHGWFHWGDEAYNSRIEGISLSVVGPLPPEDPDPVHGAEDVSVDPELSVEVDHDADEPMDVEFRDGSDGSLIGEDPHVDSGERASVNWYDLDHETEYHWFAVAEDDDGNRATSDIWEFTTKEFISPVEHKDYRFLTSESFRIGAASLNFHAYHYGYDDDEGYLGNVRIDYEDEYWWLTPGPYSDFEDPREGTMIEIEDGDGTVDDGELNENPVAILRKPDDKVGEDLWQPTIYQQEAQGDGSGEIIAEHERILNMEPVTGAVEDFVLIWEDLHNRDPPGEGPDGDGDHWVRVTELEDGRYRIHVFRAEGGFRHDFYIGAEHIYTKERNREWANTIDGVWHEVEEDDLGNDLDLPQFQVAAQAESLHFEHKYLMDRSSSGGMIYLWGADDEDDWTWDQDRRLYIDPRAHYPGTIDREYLEEEADDGGPIGDTGLRDATGELPRHVFNGKSEGGFEWRSEDVDLQRQVEENIADFDFRHIRVVFLSASFDEDIVEDEDWEQDRGWYLDNVRLQITGSWYHDDIHWAHTSAEELDEEMELETDNLEDYYDHTEGDETGHFWMFGGIDEDGRDYLPKGVDESIYTDPIYLTNAEDPTLTAHFKFNINDGEALPPDGFRVQISTDDGHSWDSLTQGARSAWNYSGQENCDYSGDTDDGEYGWVDSHSLERLDVDLSGWSGERVILRFRVFTNTTQSYADESTDEPRAFFMDDVWVTEGDVRPDDESLTPDSEQQSLEDQMEKTESEEKEDSGLAIEKIEEVTDSKNSPNEVEEKRSHYDGVYNLDKRTFEIDRLTGYELQDRSLVLLDDLSGKAQ